MLLDSSQCCVEGVRQYKKVQLLGIGSFGKAFLVKDVTDGTLCVIKQINLADLTAADRVAAEKEAKLLGMVSHPNIIQFKQAYSTPKMKLNIVMEYANGNDLAAKIKQAIDAATHFSETDILNWFTQICLAMKHIHEHKIIHRDLKGQNIFMTSDNVIKIGDFGVATLLANTMSKAKTVVGSPYYLSPEIINNRPYSFSTDVWSLGALLFEMCALVPPFTANNIQFLALKIVKGAYNQIPNIYSTPLKNLIKSMLSTKQSARPTINQILSTPLIANHLKSLHSTLSKPVRDKSQSKEWKCKSSDQFHPLEPPPNLFEREKSDEYLEQKSQVFICKKETALSPAKIKTPQSNYRKEIKVKHQPPRQRSAYASNDFQDLIQIKPSHLEQPHKLQKPFVAVPKPTSHRLIRPQEFKEVNQTDNKSAILKKAYNGFAKKKSIGEIKQPFVQDNHLFKINKEGSELKIKQVLSNRQSQQKNKSKMEKKKSNKSIANRSCRKDKKSKQKLQVCSEEVKKKMTQDNKKKPPLPKKVFHITIQEEKTCSDHQLYCQSYSNYYENERFHYDNVKNNQGRKRQKLGQSATLQLSQSTEDKCREMLKKVQNVSRVIDQLKNKTLNISFLKNQIPENQELSISIKDDLTDIQEEEKENKIELPMQFTYFSNQSEIQQMRMQLEEKFGLETLLQIHKTIEENVELFGIYVSEEDIFISICNQIPSINEKDLKESLNTILIIVIKQQEIG